jgi:hypothetical protein
VSRALRETLEAFASELVTSEILMNALADGGYDAPPENSADLQDFAEGPLRAEITAVLGGEVADAVVEGLAPVLGMMKRAERDTSAPAPPAPPTALPPSPPSPQAVVRPLRPVSRPDLPAPPPARAAIPIPPTLLSSRPPRSTTPPSRPAMGPRPPTNPNLRAVRSPTNPGDLAAVRPTSSPEVSPTRSASSDHRADLRAVRPPTSPGEARAPRPVTGVGLVDLAVVSSDPSLTAEVGARFASRRVAIGAALTELPRARVVLLDTRHALDELRATWPVASAPHVAVLWPADARERALFEALQPHVPRVVCAGDEAELSDVIMLVALQLSPS